ncbi:glycosyltransferase family 9 protein [Collimonas pratensis]|uniref:Glycosyltransferase 9 family protein n=1 Tax=Collimonas pratensis TaxID=279113 RepID=A0A127PYJ9_9BURK|nr:hypothetical protein [Collimonas pratensis]AMP02871.1 hypothetical protein CPter91_0476 [Collimonas pratensis]
MYKLRFNFFHIGDQIATTAIPENVFRASGRKCIITQPQIWAFQHNPYVVFMDEAQAAEYPEISLIPDCRATQQAQHYFDSMKNMTAGSQSEYMCVNFGVSDPVLRHPRLYLHEDKKTIPHKVVVHTSGSDRTRDGEPAIRHASGEDEVRVMSDAVLGSILENYRDYELIQVGSPADKPLGGHSIDMRGQHDYWQLAGEIASAAKFIGVNSGPMHIANCYPRLEKRIVMMELPQETLRQFRPGDVRNWLFSWLDPSNMFFNKLDTDVGLTFSHRKI